MAKAVGTPPIPLTKPKMGEDTHWLQQLPPLVLPLPKLAEPSHRLAPVLSEPATRVQVAHDLREEPTEGTAAKDVSASRETTEDAAMTKRMDKQLINEQRETTRADSIGVRKTTGPMLSEDARSDKSMDSLVKPEAGATSAAASAATPPPANLLASPDYHWNAQLLAGRSLDKVEEDRRILVKRYASILEGLTLTITQSHFGDTRDEFYRLRVLEWTSKQDADHWCARLRSDGNQCLVIRVTSPSH